MDIAQTDNPGDIYRVFGKMTSKELGIEVQGSLREDLIQTAVNFLTNPRVISSSYDLKEKFLKSKGLTSEEITTAFERSKSTLEALPLRHDSHMFHSVQSPLHAQVSWVQRCKDIALIIGASYGLYYLYKNFLAPFLFGPNDRKKSIESSINEINENMMKSIEELKSNVNQVHAELERVFTSQSEQQSYVKEIGQLKSEVAIVKGILLSRHQFPSVGLSTTSIPAWQLSAPRHKDEKELENEDVEHHSGSSETEIVQASNCNGGSQGSDSSLEMIKEGYN